MIDSALEADDDKWNQNSVKSENQLNSKIYEICATLDGAYGDDQSNFKTNSKQIVENSTFEFSLVVKFHLIWLLPLPENFIISVKRNQI